MLTGYYQNEDQSCNGYNDEGSSQSPNRNRLLNSLNAAVATGGSSSPSVASSSIYKNPTATSVLISASSSRMFTTYEISDEIARAKVQCLERKYGGRIRAHVAATRIQRAFRRFRLQQQFQHVLHHPGPPSRRRMQEIAAPGNAAMHLGDRQLYMKKLALSQPTLKYQPVTSLRAQLRAEQCSLENSFANHAFQHGFSSTRATSPSLASPVHNKSPPSPRPVEPLPLPSQRPYIELMSPRLAQRRIVTISSPLPNSHQMHHPRHLLSRSPVRNGFHKQISSPNESTAVPIVVASGTTPSVWVPRQAFEADRDLVPPNDLASRNETVSHASRMSNAVSQNGHTIAYYTNSLPRMDRRNHSVGPHHKSSVNSAELQHHLNHSITSPQAHPMRSDQQRRRWYRIALNFFNKKPDRGLHLLINWGFVDDNPQAIAKLFLGRRGLSKQMIGEFLGTLHSSFHAAVLECFINEIDMYKMEVDVALRHMLTFFRLPGEAQKIDHIMQAFGKRYLCCNPDRFPASINTDTIYVIAFAIIMLNTDLHTPSLKDSRRMKMEDFITNLRGVEGGDLLSDDMLTGIYERIKQREFKPGNDHITQVMKVDQSIIGKDKPKLVEPHRRLICYCRLHQVVDHNRKQTATAHQREIFLFNDLMLVAKIFAKKKPTAQYTLRYWTPLVGLKVSSFQNQLYNFGLHIQCPDGEQMIFNAKNNDDRLRFLADVRESVLESTEMESIRIELELDKQAPQNTMIGSRLTRPDNQRDSGLPDLDHVSPLTAIGDPNFGLENAVRTNSVTDSPGSSTMSCKPHLNGTSTSSGCSGSNASTGSASSNGTPAPVNRRLSFNSLDSGMVEETGDLPV